MALISLLEIADIAIMTAALGFIFSDMFKSASRKKDYDPLLQYRHGFDWDEFGHKFVAMAFGVAATFHAAYLWLAAGVALKLFGSPFIFFVPAFVSHMSVGPLQDTLIALSGPLVNLVLWLGALLLQKKELLNKKYSNGLLLTAKINMLLFIFNMLPIPGFDGFHFFSGLLALLF